MYIDGQEVSTNLTNANGDAIFITDKLFNNIKDKKLNVYTKDNRFLAFNKEAVIERPMMVLLDFIEAKLIL